MKKIKKIKVAKITKVKNFSDDFIKSIFSIEEKMKNNKSWNN